MKKNNPSIDPKGTNTDAVKIFLKKIGIINTTTKSITALTLVRQLY